MTKGGKAIRIGKEGEKRTAHRNIEGGKRVKDGKQQKLDNLGLNG